MVKELLKRPIGVTMSVVAIVVLSIVAMGYLPVSLMPAIDIPQITIQVSAPGLSVRLEAYPSSARNGADGAGA